MVNWIVYFLLFLLPLVYFPFGATPFETSKIFLAEIGIFLLLIIRLLRTNDFSSAYLRNLFFIKGTWHINNVKNWLLACLILLTLIHLLFFRTQLTLFGNVFRLQGLFPFWLLISLIFTAEKFQLSSGRRNFLLVGAIILTISALFIGSNIAGRAAGLLGEPNALAATAIFIWPWIFFNNKMSSRTELVCKIFSLFFVLLILFLSGSRSGLIACFLQIFFIALMSLRGVWRNKTTKQSLTTFVCIILSLSLLSWTLPFFDQKSAFENRAEIWRTAYTAGLQSPIFGNGFGNIEIALRYAAVNLRNNLRYTYVDSSHNLLLDWWVQGGIIGSVILLGLIYLTLKKFIAEERMLELTLFIGILTVISFNPVSIVTLVHFWWLIGQGLDSSAYPD